MQRVTGGYTIVEVMVVLAVTGALFLSASLLFQGQQGKSEFTDANRDLQSKIQDWTNDVTTGYYPTQNSAGNGTGYICALVSSGDLNSLKLQYAPPGQITNGKNEGCIFIGKVIQFKPGSDTITSYTILGRRQTFVNGLGVAVPDLESATPLIARNTNGGGVPGLDLTETYKIRWGGTVQPIVAPATANSTSPSYAVAIYNSFGTSNQGSSSSNSINMYTFPSADLSTADISDCIQGDDIAGYPSGICSNASGNLKTRILKKWQICLKSATSNQYATVSFTPGGDNLNSIIKYVDSC